MNGHALSGSRKLNCHWQSGSAGRPGWFKTAEEINLISYSRGSDGIGLNYTSKDGINDKGNASSTSDLHHPVSRYIGGYYSGNRSPARFSGTYNEGEGVKCTISISIPDLGLGVDQYYVQCPVGNLVAVGQNTKLDYGVYYYSVTNGFLLGGEVYFRDKPEHLSFSEYYKDGKPIDEQTCYPIKNGKIVIYLRHSLGSTIGNTGSFDIGISGLVYRKDITWGNGAGQSVNTYTGESKTIHYRVKTQKISKDDPIWGQLYLGGKWYD